jgi:hypothetical protein
MFGVLDEADGFVTGACVGGDAFIGRTLHDMFPAKRHVVIVPANRSRVAVWWHDAPTVQVIEMPPGTSFRDRNVQIVDRSALLVGIPARHEFAVESRRSGSWQTIRLARRQHLIQPYTFILEGM